MEYPVHDMSYITDRVVIDDNGCWIWQLSNDSMGYGVGAYIINNKRHRKAHRISFYLYYGYLPEDYCCHTCDVSLCCNPTHLYSGDATSNANDRENRGRGYKPLGNLNPTNILSEQDVINIRNLYATGDYSYQQLADIFDTAKTNIGAIIRRETWNHI